MTWRIRLLRVCFVLWVFAFAIPFAWITRRCQDLANMFWWPCRCSHWFRDHWTATAIASIALAVVYFGVIGKLMDILERDNDP
jgi:hypothetical protein